MALKFITADAAALYISHNDSVGFSGFTSAGCPKMIPSAIARRAEEEHAKGNPFQIGIFTGASTGDSLDGALARAQAIKFRTPYQSSKDLRALMNSGGTNYFDIHLSELAQGLRYGFFGKVNVAIIEAADVSEDGEIVLTKTCSGIYVGTPIDRVLRNLGIVNVIVTGFYTDQCVSTSVRDLSDLGYRVAIIDDAVAAMSRERHEMAMNGIGNIYARKESTAELLARLEAL
jgi:hypothetical protein